MIRHLPATLLGVDVGSRLRNAGVAVGHWTGDELVIDAVEAGADLPGRNTDPSIDAVATWLAARVPSDGPVLLALDAPLGWPAPLSEGLADHAAGDRLPASDPDRLWRRATDVDVHARHGKLPLEVGANYIARAAWTALEILDAVRARTGRPLPVVLAPDEAPTAAIETYPAATLRAWLGEDPGSYKARDPMPRRALLDRLRQTEPFRLTAAAEASALSVDHAFDALICVLAGADFIRGRVPPVPPELHRTARREGWIHVR